MVLSICPLLACLSASAECSAFDVEGNALLQSRNRRSLADEGGPQPPHQAPAHDDAPALPVGFSTDDSQSVYWAGDASQLDGFESTDEKLLQPRYALTFDGHNFCAHHYPVLGKCVETCTESSFANGSARAHLLYLHTDKTGGSSLECATQNTFAEMGIWTNMGHTRTKKVNHCREHCSSRTTAQTVMSVRDPYSFWKSQYEYEGPWFNTTKKWKFFLENVNWDTTFLQFMQLVQENKRTAAQGAYHFTQTSAWHRMLGKQMPDHVLHTERLSHDWFALLRSLKLPLVDLPHENSASEKASNVPPVKFTEDVIAIIDDIDADMFTRFGYAKRTAAELADLES